MRTAGRLVVMVALAGGCKDGGKTAPPAPPADGTAQVTEDQPMDWDRAEEIARTHREQQGSGTAPLVRHPRVKYLFQAAHWYVLVHRGAVLDKQGSASLATYLSEIPLDDRKALLAEDLVVLVRLLGAFPPVTGKDPLRFLEGPDQPAVQPQLDWAGDRGAFRLYYDLTKNEDQLEDPDLRDLAEWTLTIEPAGKSAWSQTRRRYHRGRKAFVP